MVSLENLSSVKIQTIFFSNFTFFREVTEVQSFVNFRITSVVLFTFHFWFQKVASIMPICSALSIFSGVADVKSYIIRYVLIIPPIFMKVFWE